MLTDARRHHLLHLLFLCFPLLAAAQPPASTCGTLLSEADMALQRQFNTAWAHSAPAQIRSGSSITHVPVQLHIIQSSAGTGGISPSAFAAALERVNTFYADAGIHFFQCAAINYIQDDVHYSHDYSELNTLHSAYSVSNVINIYCTDIVTAGASNICGYAQFPGGADFIMLQTDCALNNSTFEHEIGHYFNLYHTHETGLGTELVNGTNCGSAGDYVCDTPADPRLSGATNFTEAGCIYYGTETDGNGSLYSPSVVNIMSYASKSCRTMFSAGQISRMNFALTNYRSYLTCGVTPTLEAEFYASMDTSCNDMLPVDFCDVSEGVPTSWSWDFGDGNSSNAQHPTHTYANAGVYTVSLTAVAGPDSDTYTRSNLVRVGVTSLPYTNDFESGSSDLGDFQRSVSAKNFVQVGAAAAYSGASGLVMEGYPENISAYFQTPTAATAFDSLWNQLYKSRFDLCIDATNYSTLELSFDIRQLHGFNSNYTNFRVLANGDQIGTVYQPAGTDGNWLSESIDLSAYASDIVTISFEGSHKYSVDYQTTNGNATLLDNISITGTQTLPVELASLSAEAQGRATRLNWSTYTERQNAYFEVQHRRANAPAWEVAGEVPGAGYADVLQSYVFIDPVPATYPADTWYYRLRQVDFNGAESFSDQVALSFSQEANISLMPNPATGGSLRLVSEAQLMPPTHVWIMDQTGREVLRQQLDPAAGAWEILLGDLADGLYYLKLFQDGKMHTRQIQVVR